MLKRETSGRPWPCLHTLKLGIAPVARAAGLGIALAASVRAGEQVAKRCENVTFNE